MNITDFDSSEALKEAKKTYGTEDPLELIFLRQRELMAKYLPIEEEILGLRFSTGSLVANLDHSTDQHLLKTRAWWVTEELAEATDALLEGHEQKFLEELSDALHFLTELCILSGLGPKDMEGLRKKEYLVHKVEEKVLEIIRSLGMTMWQLRNKPWKQTQIPTDYPRYQGGLIMTFKMLVRLIMNYVGGEIEFVTALYLQKSLVNQFRIRSKY